MTNDELAELVLEWRRLRRQLSAFRHPGLHVVEYSDLCSEWTRAEGALASAADELLAQRKEGA